MEKSSVAVFSAAPAMLLLLLFAQTIDAQSFDFFYFVQQWPGSYCDTSSACCYPTTGKPASDFGIHGLWPNYNDGSYPSNCDSSNPFKESLVKDLEPELQAEWPTLACPSANGVAFWTHEWDKHGTCSESVLDQRGYFEATLSLRQNINLLGALTSAGIYPDSSSYSLNSIKTALRNGVGQEVGIECNKDADGSSQLYQIYVCVDTDGSTIVPCPVLPGVTCSSSVLFPAF